MVIDWETFTYDEWDHFDGDAWLSMALEESGSELEGTFYSAISELYSNAQVSLEQSIGSYQQATNIVLNLNKIQPEIDLLVIFYRTFESIRQSGSRPAILNAVSSINKHVKQRGNHSTLNDYFQAEGILVLNIGQNFAQKSGTM
ncbi:MAG: hypothetical protein HC888_04595 [Candidatus Competibacteraceae bacterium]|nr:hypothetical protein [Candidatus Competibacteraceae bacterium]